MTYFPALGTARTLFKQAFYLMKNSKLKFVYKPSGFPSAVAGVRTLEDNTTYVIVGTVDLAGDRLVCGDKTAFFGFSPEVSILKSTGFDDTGGAFLTAVYTVPINFVGFHEFGTEQVLDIDGAGNDAALDWSNINFLNCSNVGTIANVSNFIGGTMGLLSSAGLVFDGEIGTVSFNASIFTFFGGGTIITLPSTLEITRRFRVIYSAFVVTSGNTAINVSTSAIIPDEAYILDTVNFGGGGTYTSGVDFEDPESLFINNIGINNSSIVGNMYMTGNATSTSLATSGTFYKVAGTSTIGPLNERFTHTSGRLTYQGAFNGFFKAAMTFTAQTNNNTDFTFRLAKNGTTEQSASMVMRQNSNAEYTNILVQGIFNLEAGDYIECFVSADADNRTITVTEQNMIIERIN